MNTREQEPKQTLDHRMLPYDIPLSDWQLVVDLEPAGYAEVRTADSSVLYHGPVEKVEIDGMDLVWIHFKWQAKVPLTPSGLPLHFEWEIAPNEPVVFPNIAVAYRLQNTEKGPRVLFGLNILYINAQEGLDPTKIRGLILPTTTSLTNS